jgi:acylphosphatase
MLEGSQRKIHHSRSANSQFRDAPTRTSAKIPHLLFASRSGMHETQVARRYYVSGMVQGVGYRYFVRQLAQRLGIAGYVKNLRDGRVEVYAVGPPTVLASLRSELERGPNGASVASVSEEPAPIDPKFAARFSVERDTWT